MAFNLDKIISDIKEKLPFGKSEDNDDDNTTEVDVSQLDEDEVEEDEDDEDLDEAEEKKKKRSKIFRIIIIVCIVLVAASEFLFPTGEDGEKTQETTQMSAQEKKIQEMRKKRRAAKAKRLAEKKAKEEEARKAQELAEKRRAEELARLKAEQEAERKAAEAEELRKAEEAAKAAQATKVEAPTDEQDKADSVESAIVDAESKIDTPQETAPVVQKIRKYASPPDYEVVGRGLVYNCKGKHWACVDRKSYFQCRKNERWHSQEKSKKECHIFNVYSSEDDCVKMQKYNTNMNVPTDFCN